MSKVFGWITPTKRFIEVEPYTHLETLKDDDEINKLIPKLNDKLYELEDLRTSCQSRVDDGDHPEWHVYECERSDLEGYLYTELYKAGAIRVGSTYSNNPSCTFEALPEVIQSNYQFCKDFAEEHGMDPKFEPVKYY